MFFDIIETYYNFTEKLVARTKDVSEEDAHKLAQSRYRQQFGKVIRVYWRPARLILTTAFYETEQQVIEFALKELLGQNVNLNGHNLALQVERKLIERMEDGVIPWADPDLLGAAITKLSNMPSEKRQQLLQEYIEYGS